VRHVISTPLSAEAWGAALELTMHLSGWVWGTEHFMVALGMGPVSSKPGFLWLKIKPHPIATHYATQNPSPGSGYG